MSLLPNITYANPNTPLYGAGGGGSGSNLNDITVSTITFSGNAPPNSDITFPSGYTANVSADNFYITDTTGSNAQFRFATNFTGGSNGTLLVAGSQGGWYLSSDQNGNGQLNPTIASSQISISNITPQIINAQFLDINTALPSPIIGSLNATPSGFSMLNSTNNGFALNVSSINISSINNYPADKLISSIVGTW